MKMAPFAFGTTDWSRLEPTEHKGETGMATWRTCHFGAEPDRIRVRMVEYTPGYLADHWCKKGHILFCMEGALETTLEDGRKFVLTAGMSYQVGDNAEAHRSYTRSGARLFIVDCAGADRPLPVHGPRPTARASRPANASAHRAGTACRARASRHRRNRRDKRPARSSPAAFRCRSRTA